MGILNGKKILLIAGLWFAVVVGADAYFIRTAIMLNAGQVMEVRSEFK